MWILGRVPSLKLCFLTSSTMDFIRFWESLTPTWQIDEPMQATEVSSRFSALSFNTSSTCRASLAVRLMTYMASSGSRRIST